MRVVDAFTNYRSRYGFPAWIAVIAEVWWRLEHIRMDSYDDDHPTIWQRIRIYAYPQRKAWERRGIARRAECPGR